uniref:proprotein convertase P-domain-containing protein n=1 Tax=Actinokineospora fastidiosa TaxID=1816 RepID=UPI003570A716
MRVAITARHTCQEDLRVRVVSPAGWWYNLKYSGGSTCTPFPGTVAYSFSPFTEQASGTWTLEITDTGTGDTGVLDSWSITL